jgi:hypothetical protein
MVEPIAYVLGTFRDRSDFVATGSRYPLAVYAGTEETVRALLDHRAPHQFTC